MDTVSTATAKPRRTKPRGRHPDKALSAAFIRSAPPGRHADGNGLFLYVKPEGTRSWIQRLVIRGRRREMGLGSVALVSLAESRELALANRKLARSRAATPLLTSAESRAFRPLPKRPGAWWSRSVAGWRGRWHAQNWLRSLERYAFPRIGSRPVSQVNSADVLENPHADLAREAGDGAGSAPESPVGAGVGRGDGDAHGQSLRPRPAGARSPGRHRAAHAGARSQGRGRGGGGRCGSQSLPRRR